MRKQISKISVLQTSKMITLMYIVFSLLYVPFGIGMIVRGSGETKAMGVFYLCRPIVIGILGSSSSRPGRWCITCSQTGLAE